MLESRMREKLETSQRLRPCSGVNARVHPALCVQGSSVLHGVTSVILRVFFRPAGHAGVIPLAYRSCLEVRLRPTKTWLETKPINLSLDPQNQTLNLKFSAY